MQQEYFFLNRTSIFLICDDVVAGAVIVSLTPRNKNEVGGGGGLGIPTTHLKTNSIILAIFFCLVLSKLSSAVDSYNAWKRHARFVKENSHVKTVPERFLLN